MEPNGWKLAPSDFGFIWEECKRCFYLKVVGGFQRPQMPMPKVFTLIDSQMKTCFMGKRTESVSPNMPNGTFEYAGKRVESVPIAVKGFSTRCFIRGNFDTVVTFDDGSFGIIDFKTSQVKPEHVSLYARQLQAYAHALENPAEGKFGLKPVSRLGLLMFEPSQFSNDLGGGASLTGSLTWVELPRDNNAFLGFLADVLSVLDLPSPPEASSSCSWCKYRELSRRFSY